MNSEDAGTISALVLAFVILLAFVVYTWIKWRRRQIKKMKNPEDYESHIANNQGEQKRTGEGTAQENLALKLRSMENMTGSSTLVDENAEEAFYSKNAHSSRPSEEKDVYEPKEHTRTSKLDLFSKRNSRNGDVQESRHDRSQDFGPKGNDDHMAFERKPRSKSEGINGGDHPPPPSYRQVYGARANYGNEDEKVGTEQSRKLSTYL